MGTVGPSGGSGREVQRVGISFAECEGEVDVRFGEGFVREGAAAQEAECDGG